jgi:predicted lipoprotein with Yx(FWY)xxD motif
MHSRLFLTGGVVAAAFIAAACSPATGSTNPYGAPTSAAPSAAPVAAPSAPPAAPAATGTAINTGTTKLGQLLVDSNGLTVYLFLADKGTASSCNSAACVQY